jgi:hypothetical protein
LTVAAFPPLSGVSAAFAGPPSVCPTCLGGTATESHLGGGGVTHQWGYRLVSAGPITPIPGQTGASYVLNGADFPGPASYFLVVTTTPASGCAGGPQESNEIPVDVVLAVPADDVKYFTVTSRNTENVLEWVYPSGFATVSIHATSGPTCAPPTDPFSPVTWITDETGAAGMRHRYSHGGLTPGTTYCYTLFVDTGGGTYSAGRSNRGRPMSPGPVQWAFSTGVFSLTAPTVGGAGVIATSNDHVVHAMVRGASPPAGEWPVPWLPKPVGGPVQSRSPIIPIDVGPLPSNPVVYVGSQDGNVYVADAAQGGAVLDPWAPVALGGLPGQAAPAGMFKDFGGDYDLLLVGTRQDLADNRFYAIDPINGGPPIDFYDDSAGAGIGIINGMATVDYGNNRVYFASRKRTGGASTLWCLNLLSQSAPVFSLRWENTFDDIDSSPVLMGGRVYVVGALNGGRLYSVNADDGSFYALNIGDGQAKDFVFPDYWNPGDLYFAGDNSIWAMNDNGTNITFKPPLVAPVSLGGAIPTSGVLLVPGTQLLYVGANDGHLYEIDFSQDPPALKSVQLGDGLATVGSPSLDWPNDLIHVGTEAGVFYAVDIPLP